MSWRVPLACMNAAGPRTFPQSPYGPHRTPLTVSGTDRASELLDQLEKSRLVAERGEILLSGESPLLLEARGDRLLERGQRLIAMTVYRVIASEVDQRVGPDVGELGRAPARGDRALVISGVPKGKGQAVPSVTVL